jgi:hypothetical protein
MVFTVSHMPPGVPGIFFYGQQQTQVPFGGGWRCVTGSAQRVMPPQFASASGVTTYAVDLSSYPFAGSLHPITPGSAWNFQFWYRDPHGGPTNFNLSDAQHVVFAP